MIITVYDNNGESFDRYTLRIGKDFWGMSENALSPDGFCQYLGGVADGIKVGNHLGRRVERLERLPKDVREVIANKFMEFLY